MQVFLSALAMTSIAPSLRTRLVLGTGSAAVFLVVLWLFVRRVDRQLDELKDVQGDT